jgi:hypothetical protein
MPASEVHEYDVVACVVYFTTCCRYMVSIVYEPYACMECDVVGLVSSMLLAMWLPMCLPRQYEGFIRSGSAFQVRREGLHGCVGAYGVTEVALAAETEDKLCPFKPSVLLTSPPG